MKTCDTCRYWGINRAAEWHSAETPERKLCGSPKITDGVVMNAMPDTAAAVDCENYHAFLQTGPKFGCIHHEPA